MIEIQRVTLSKELLCSIDESELTCFVALGHLANELGVLKRLLLWSSGASPAEGVLYSAEQAQALMLTRLLAGKLHEGRLLCQRVYFSSQVSRVFDLDMPEEARGAIRQIKRYFSGSNLLSLVRSKYAFHYDKDTDFNQALELVWEAEEYELFLTELDGASMYYGAEVAVNKSLLEAIRPGDQAEAIKTLSDELLEIMRLFTTFISGFMEVFCKRHLKSGKGFEVKAVPHAAPDLFSIRLPVFVSYSNGCRPNPTNPADTTGAAE